jgi:membrane protein DedA with SNARE-associated domain
MIYDLLTHISSFIVNVISSLGYAGITALMALESACIPIPSEIIMPFSGYLVWEGRFVLLSVILWGTIGNLIGSIIAYFIGIYGGRPLIEKYGKYILISSHDLGLAERWFKKYGNISVFFSRMLPIVRTFISVPAGVARMPFWKFCFYTFAGSLPWAFILTYVGVIMGENWSGIEVYFRKFDWLIVILVGLLIGWFIYKKIKKPSFIKFSEGEKKNE